MESTSCLTNFFTWNTTSQKVAASVAIIATSILITGIVLMALSNSHALATGLLIGESTGLTLDLIYIAIAKRREAKKYDPSYFESEPETDFTQGDMHLLRPRQLTWKDKFAAASRQIWKDSEISSCCRNYYKRQTVHLISHWPP